MICKIVKVIMMAGVVRIALLMINDYRVATSCNAIDYLTLGI